MAERNTQLHTEPNINQYQVNTDLKVLPKQPIFPVGKIIHVEVEGKEILIANVAGKFYAVGVAGSSKLGWLIVNSCRGKRFEPQFTGKTSRNLS